MIASVLRSLRRIAGLTTTSARDERLQEEVEAHLRMAAEANIERGMAPAAARRAAQLAFGPREQFKDEARDEFRSARIEHLVRDVRYAVRGAGRSPGFTATVVLTLGLAIGANTTIFTVVNAVLLRPLTFPHGEQVVALYAQNPSKSLPRFSTSYADYRDWRDQTHSFSGMALFGSTTLNLTGGDAAERLAGFATTGNFFDVLNIQPALGRLFGPADDDADASVSVILSHAFWKRRFGGDTGMIGRTIQLNGRARTVVGVMPASFEFDGRPIDAVTVIAPGGIPGGENHGQHLFEALARMKPGVTLAQAQQDLAAVAIHLAEVHADIAGWTANVFSFQDELVRGTREPLLVLSAAAGLVLLIGCMNVANLLLVRGASRDREIALRQALGASRRRLISQLLIESLVLAGAAALLGIGLGVVGTHLLLQRVPPNLLPNASAVRLDWHVLGFALALGGCTAVAVGLWPAARRTSGKVADVLQHGRRGAAGSLRASRTRHVLVITELGLALTLLVCAGLVLQSLQRLVNVDPGFRPDRVATMSLTLPGRTYPDSMQAPFYQQLLTRLVARPGIEAAGAANTLPISVGGVTTNVRPLGRSDGSATTIMNPVTAITPGYFATLGIPIRAGRDIAWTDAKPVIVVTELAARRLWPGETPLGKRIAFSKTDTAGIEVVGVVGATHARGLANDQSPMIYLSLDGAASVVRNMSLVVRGKGDAQAIAAITRSVIGELDRSLPLYNVQSVRNVIDRSVAQPRLNTALLTVFAAMALVLAAIGIYGVISFSVAQRTQEIGVRMALGAQQSQVFGLVLREGAALVGLGTLLGLGGAWAATPLIRSWLFGITTTDPATLAGMTAVLAVLALVASYVPARRATRVDPAIAMRAD